MFAEYDNVFSFVGLQTVTTIKHMNIMKEFEDFKTFNPYLTNGFSHHYHLGESIFILRNIKSDFQFLNKFLMKILLANRIAPDGTPRSAASHLGLCCLPMSHKKDARLIRVKHSRIHYKCRCYQICKTKPCNITIDFTYLLQFIKHVY